MKIFPLNVAILCTFLTLFVPDVSGSAKLRKIQNTLDHFFVEIGKVRLELSDVKYRIDSLEELIENGTLLSNEGIIQKSSDTGTFGQPLKDDVEEQENEDKSRVDPDVMKKTMKMVLKSLSKEKLILRDVVKGFDDRLKNVEIGNDFEKRLRGLEEKMKRQPAHVNNPANNKVDVAVKRDVKYSFSARLSSSREILPSAELKRLGHKMHTKRLQFRDVIHNVGNAYDSTSGKFTCKKDGVYLFIFFVEGVFRKNYPVGKQTSMVALSVDGKYQTLAASKALSEDGRYTGGNSVILHLRRGQEVWLETVAQISQMITLRQWVTTFSGTLLF